MPRHSCSNTDAIGTHAEAEAHHAQSSRDTHSAHPGASSHVGVTASHIHRHGRKHNAVRNGASPMSLAVLAALRQNAMDRPATFLTGALGRMAHQGCATRGVVGSLTLQAGQAKRAPFGDRAGGTRACGLPAGWERPSSSQAGTSQASTDSSRHKQLSCCVDADNAAGPEVTTRSRQRPRKIRMRQLSQRTRCALALFAPRLETMPSGRGPDRNGSIC